MATFLYSYYINIYAMMYLMLTFARIAFATHELENQHVWLTDRLAMLCYFLIVLQIFNKIIIIIIIINCK